MRIEGYFIVDYLVLSLSHQRTLGGSYAPALTVGKASKIWEVARKLSGSPVSVFTRVVVHSIYLSRFLHRIVLFLSSLKYKI